MLQYIAKSVQTHFFIVVKPNDIALPNEGKIGFLRGLNLRNVSMSSDSSIALLYPPLNYGAVENDLYRSAVPSEINYGFLATLKIKVP